MATDHSEVQRQAGEGNWNDDGVKGVSCTKTVELLQFYQGCVPNLEFLLLQLTAREPPCRRSDASWNANDGCDSVM